MSKLSGRKDLFQSTLPHGERHDLLSEAESLENRAQRLISIHTPTRGATSPAPSSSPSAPHFNPRSHTGSDSLPRLTGLASREFQSTLPHGERHCYLCGWKGCYSISIHAPTRGATTEIYTHEYYTLISIHAPTRGATSII